MTITKEHLDAYAAYIKKDYGGGYKSEEFLIIFEEGNKYIKVVASHHGSNSAHSFICKKDDEKKGFKVGDILKANSWKAPAVNFIRGNVILGIFSRIRWTGAF